MLPRRRSTNVTTTHVPPLLPRQSHPHLPPGDGELGRQSTQRNTYDTRRPAPEEEVSSQGTSEHPPTSVRPLQHAPGGGAGGFASIPPPPHNTADYAYRFYSPPAYNEPAGISEGIHVRLWPTYNKVSQEFDEKRLKLWNEDLDVLLIFVSLVGCSLIPIRTDTRPVGRLVLRHRHSLPHQGPR